MVKRKGDKWVILSAICTIITVLTTGGIILWKASDLSAKVLDNETFVEANVSLPNRVAELEKDTNELPERLATIETKLDNICEALKDIKKEIEK